MNRKMLPIFLLILLASASCLHAEDSEFLIDEECIGENCEVPDLELAEPDLEGIEKKQILEQHEENLDVELPEPEFEDFDEERTSHLSAEKPEPDHEDVEEERTSHLSAEKAELELPEPDLQSFEKKRTSRLRTEKPERELPKVLKRKRISRPRAEKPEFSRAEECSTDKCQAPDCRCSGLPLPKPSFEGFEKKIPQFITVTFDDAVNIMNYPKYEHIFKGLKTSDNCSAHATFFVSHEYTDYSIIHALYSEGHEIGLHSVTHSTPISYWRDASVDQLMREFGHEIEMLESYAYVNRNHIRGIRLPFLQTSGNNSYIAAKKLGLLYDSSMPTSKFRDPPMWPYTLDYLTAQECQVGTCPDASIPGFWVSPMVSWNDNEGNKCSMMDSCYYIPKDDIDQIVDWMMENFKRHYDSNRAPFGMYLHASFFDRSENYVLAFRKFLEHVATLPDVYITTMSQVIQYMRNPVLGKPYRSCPKRPETKKCVPRNCRIQKVSVNELRYMTLCGQCPKVYPWLDNPLGLKIDGEE